jgi:hypothetical protein
LLAAIPLTGLARKPPPADITGASRQAPTATTSSILALFANGWKPAEPRPNAPVSVREFSINAALARPASEFRRPHLTVAPLDVDNGLLWIDPAGYQVAHSARPASWPEHPASFDFELIVSQATIVGSAYLRHV